MTYPINYPAEVRASKARHEKRIAEAKRAFDALEAKQRANPNVRGRPRARAHAERDRAILLALAGGTSDVELAARYGLKASTVRQIASNERARQRRPGEAVPEKRSPHDAALVERNRTIYDAAMAGTPTPKLAADYRLKRKTIDLIVRQERRRRGEPAAPNKRLLRPMAERNRAMLEAREDGKTYREISQRYGIAPSTIATAVRRERARLAAGRAA